MNFVDAVLKVLSQDYVPYGGEVAAEVYDELGCPHPGKARWFAHQAKPKICLGCKACCIAESDAGFQLLLPTERSMRGKVLFVELPAVSIEHLLQVKACVTVPETAVCLSVSERHVYDLIDEGRLDKVSENKPVRITTASIRRQLGMEG